MGGPGPQVVSCAEIAGEAVVNTAGEPLGRLEQLLVDVPSGRIERAVFARGGVFGIGARFFSVPWSDLAHDPKARCFILDVSKQALDSFLSSYDL